MKPTLLRRLQLATAALLAFTALPVQAQLSVDVTGEIDSNVKVAVPPLPAQQEVATPAGSAATAASQPRSRIFRSRYCVSFPRLVAKRST